MELEKTPIIQKKNSNVISVRRSVKPPENSNEEEELISLLVLREGTWKLYLPDTKIWKSFFFLITESTLYWQKKESSTRLSGNMLLKDISIEKMNGPSNKYSFGLKISNPEKSIAISTPNESLQLLWFKDLTEGVSSVSNQSPARQGKTLRVQKRVGGTIATSTAGKKIIKEALGQDGYKGIKVIKTVINTIHGKKKALEIEELIIKLGVKIVLLTRNNLLTVEDLKLCKTDLKMCCDLISHSAAFTYEYSADTLAKKLHPLSEGILVMLQYHLSDKNKSKVTELISYLLSEPVLDTLYKHQDLKEARKDMTYLMKNISARLDTI